ncbi:MAG: SPOR domain-containing protein [Sphingomonadales bacterium]|nr:SPOR domain-containing protein [Sphingomonadales bacterium]MDE2168348.1 SPOR domain-containing protein [Sphingomonadales bacterium]
MIGHSRARPRLGLMPGAGPRGWLMLAGAGAALGGVADVSAQSLPVVSHPVVQPLPAEGGAAAQNDPARQLSNALGRVGRNPRDADALADAGNAAMAMGDESAADNFYARADKIEPGNPKIAAGWATLKLRAYEPVAAITLYDLAARNGPLTAGQLADRGLAHDLVGDNANAQRFYREAVAGGAGDEAVRRLALSLAIAGDRKGMEATLAPLLQKQDRAAWRTRAFAYAILGREDEAVAIAKSTMPTELANGMAPFLRFMRKLTPAQQAAAANLGRFPRAADIGKDDPRILAYASQHGVRHLAAADAPLVPSGASLGPATAEAPSRREETRASRRKDEQHELPPVNAAPSLPSSNPLPPDPKPSREVSPPPALASSPPPRRELASEAPRPAPAALPSAPLPPATSSAATGKPQPAGRFDLAQLPAGGAPAPAVTGPVADMPRSQPAPAEARVAVAPPRPVPPAPVETRPAPAPTRAKAHARAPSRKASFAEAFSAWAEPEAKGKVSEAPMSGAVDLRKIKPRRPPPKAPPPPAYPSRVWVQVGVGRSADRIAFDWRKMTRENPKLLAGQKAWTSNWGRTNRVLVGPFDDEADAKAFLVKAKKAGLDDAFMWLSAEGQEVDELGK